MTEVLIIVCPEDREILCREMPAVPNEGDALIVDGKEYVVSSRAWAMGGKVRVALYVQEVIICS